MITPSCSNSFGVDMVLYLLWSPNMIEIQYIQNVSVLIVVHHSAKFLTYNHQKLRTCLSIPNQLLCRIDKSIKVLRRIIDSIKICYLTSIDIYFYSITCCCLCSIYNYYMIPRRYISKFSSCNKMIGILISSDDV